MFPSSLVIAKPSKIRAKGTSYITSCFFSFIIQIPSFMLMIHHHNNSCFEFHSKESECINDVIKEIEEEKENENKK